MVALTSIFPSGFKATSDSGPKKSEIPEIQFQRALESFGFETGIQVIADGVIHRGKVAGDKGGKKSGWYVLFVGGPVAAGSFGNWRLSESQTWREPTTKTLTWQDQAEIQRRMALAKKMRDEQIAQWREDAAEQAAQIINDAQDAKGDHPYLIKKGIAPPKGLKQINGHLHAPVLNFDGEIMSVQTINKTGEKLFLKGGKTKGGFFPLPGDTSTIYVGEGIATCATVHEATGSAVYAAFSAGNLTDVAVGVRKEHPDSQIVLLADNDDAGKKCSAEAAQAVGGKVVVAEGEPGCDFNDLAVDGTRTALGITAVNDQQVTDYLEVDNLETASGVVVPSKLKTIPGMIGEYITHVLASSRKQQPVYAVAGAMVVGSVIIGRLYETSEGDRAGIFVMGIGPTGSGKEVTRDCNKALLKQAGLDSRIAGEEIKSDTGLLMRMSSSKNVIIQLDEFGLMLQRFSNQRAGGHEKAIVSLLMKLWSSTNTTMYGPEYAREDRVDIEYPSCNVFATTTAETLWPALTGSEILSGAINRILMCELDSPDAPHVTPSRRSADIPQAIVDWAIEAAQPQRTFPVTPDHPFIIDIDKHAQKIIREFAERVEIKAKQHRGTGIDSLYVRAVEQVKRVAMIVAVSVNVKAPVINFEVAEWCIEFVDFWLGNSINQIKRNLGNSDFDRLCKKVEQTIANICQRSVGATEREISKFSREYRASTPMQRDQVLNALRRDGAIEQGSRIGQNGKTTHVWLYQN
jgi:phage/plasmid primase-like uncharacterized protein